MRMRLQVALNNVASEGQESGEGAQWAAVELSGGHAVHNSQHAACQVKPGLMIALNSVSTETSWLKE